MKVNNQSFKKKVLNILENNSFEIKIMLKMLVFFCILVRNISINKFYNDEMRVSAKECEKKE